MGIYLFVSLTYIGLTDKIKMIFGEISQILLCYCLFRPIGSDFTGCEDWHMGMQTGGTTVPMQAGRAFPKYLFCPR